MRLPAGCHMALLPWVLVHGLLFLIAGAQQESLQRSPAADTTASACAAGGDGSACAVSMLQEVRYRDEPVIILERDHVSKLAGQHVSGSQATANEVMEKEEDAWEEKEDDNVTVRR